MGGGGHDGMVWGCYCYCVISKQAPYCAGGVVVRWFVVGGVLFVQYYRPHFASSTAVCDASRSEINVSPHGKLENVSVGSHHDCSVDCVFSLYFTPAIHCWIVAAFGVGSVGASVRWRALSQRYFGRAYRGGLGFGCFVFTPLEWNYCFVGMNAIILCGGLSTRLGDITKSVPKILLDIKGRSVLDWQLEKLRVAGVNKVVLAAGHLAGVLQDTVGLERNGIELVYAIEPERLGTGGAIKFALSHVENPEDPTIILNGDILTSVDLAAMVAALPEKSEGIILGARVSDAASYGTLVYDEYKKLTAFKEKEGLHQEGYINGGFYLFRPEMSRYFPEAKAFSVEYDVFPRVENLHVLESNDPWIDIGVPERLAWAREYWSE